MSVKRMLVQICSIRGATLLFSLAMALVFTQYAHAQTPGTWNPAGDVSVGNGTPTAVLLNDGTALVVGGGSEVSDLYNPATNTWTTVGSMSTARTYQAGTILADGRVLIVGGQDPNSQVPLASAEIYDPSTQSWSPTGSLNTARYQHSATLLPSGKVLVAGGWPVGNCCAGSQYPLTSSELWDPATGAWTLAGDMPNPHAVHTATLLSDGRVLIAGGENYAQGYLGREASPDAEIYDPSSGSWTNVSAMSSPRDHTTGTRMSDGRVLLAGGSSGGCCAGVATAELFDPVTLSWTSVYSMSAQREGAAASAISGGAGVLVSGGYSDCCDAIYPTRDSSEVFDLPKGWHLTGSLGQPRAYHTSLTLSDGTVLVVGGGASAERYYPDPNMDNTVTVQIQPNVVQSTFTVTGTGCSAGTSTAYESVSAAFTWTPGAACTVLASGPSGWTFSNWDDGSTDNPRTFVAPNTQTTYFPIFSQD